MNRNADEVYWATKHYSVYSLLTRYNQQLCKNSDQPCVLFCDILNTITAFTVIVFVVEKKKKPSSHVSSLLPSQPHHPSTYHLAPSHMTFLLLATIKLNLSLVYSQGKTINKPNGSQDRAAHPIVHYHRCYHTQTSLLYYHEMLVS